jgi:hypothetical protein
MGLLYTVTTCKENLDTVQRFVAANLAGGADHVFVFLDEPDTAISAALAAEPHATAITTDDSYWRGRRPPNVNSRQKLNANLIRTLLAPLPWADWLFHLDADETLNLDRQVLAGLPATERAVRLLPWEVVSTEQPGWDGWYKRLLTPDELALLRLLGAVREARNVAYFRGHHYGKVGVRPGLDVALAIHHVSADGAKVATLTHPSLSHLHDNSPTFEEFVRRWTREARQTDAVYLGPRRQRVRAAVRALLDAPLEPDRRREILHELYLRTSVDPVDLLHELGLLQTVDPRLHRHTPQGHSPEQARTLERLMEALLAESPILFRVGAKLATQAEALQRAVRRLGDPDLISAVDALTPPAPLPASPGPDRLQSVRGFGGRVRRTLRRA